MRQTSSSSPSLLFNNNNYSLNTFYRPNINNFGTTSLYINRKLAKTTTAPVTRKNGKGKGGKNRTTTPKPLYTTVMLNQYSSSVKVTKNKSKSTSVSFNRMTSTMRPRTTSKPGNKSQMNFDSGKNLLSSKGGKVQAANSNIYEKSPGKAPKQVKEITTQSPMLKMFERYEKIQEIYPQLKPYKDNENPAYFTISNGNKPSRENSKSFGFVSVNSAPQKKNSPSDERQPLEKSEKEKGTNRIYLRQFTCCSLVLLIVSVSSFVVFLTWFISDFSSGLRVKREKKLSKGFNRALKRFFVLKSIKFD